MNWFNFESEEVLKQLKSHSSGLSRKEVQNRLLEHGLNKLPETKADSLWVVFGRQFKNPLIYVLLAASLIFFLLGEQVDGLIVLAVLIFNAIIGTVQEGRAQNTLAALKKFIETNTTVIREGRELIISDTEVVPGDIIVLQEGERVPADARVIEAHQLRIDEAALTGKSNPIYKKTDRIDQKSALADQVNMVFKGTHVLAGTGLAVVVATGIKTEIGQISKEIIGIDSSSPLKGKIEKLSRLIILVFSVVAVYLFCLAWLSDRNMLEAFEAIIAISVSVIPEGLPIVITLVLAAGVWRMGKRNALVKRLQAIEALGGS